MIDSGDLLIPKEYMDRRCDRRSVIAVMLPV